MGEYDSALDVLSAISQDSWIFLSEKKWNETRVQKATLHLNKSTCFYKLKNWHAAIEEACACLTGNDLEEMKYVDPHLGGRLENADRKHGYMKVARVESKLPSATKTKAWIRLAKCYVQQGFPVRGKQALMKARELCDQNEVLPEISRLWK